ncbi:hypothetical protein FXO37_22163 [Capsicum annuum]|nr:hypothetical protein FXO37_22163 [Capsicum annuum]
MILHIFRVGKQQLREAWIVGLCLGTLAKVSDETLGLSTFTPALQFVSSLLLAILIYLHYLISLYLNSNLPKCFPALLTEIPALRSFSLDTLHYWRESASVTSSLAYFLAKDMIDHINTIVRPAVYLSMFYFFNNPRSLILDNYVVLLCVVYCVTGIAYALSIYFEPGQAQLVCTQYFDLTIHINSNRYPLLPQFSTNKLMCLSVVGVATSCLDPRSKQGQLRSLQ